MTVKSMVLKKCYLLAGVMMAANIFVVNEVMAMEKMDTKGTLDISLENDINDIKGKPKNEAPLPFPLTVSGFILSWENSINFTVGSALSLANNYFKLWDYNKGGYWKLGCLGWRSGRFANGIFQFDININLGRGFSWLIPGLYNFVSVFQLKNDKLEEGTSQETLTSSYFHSTFLIGHIVKEKTNEDTLCIIVFGLAFCLQGFVSMPLVIHISTFDFTIALDSLIWCGVGFLSHLGDNTENEKDKLIEKPDDKENK